MTQKPVGVDTFVRYSSEGNTEKNKGAQRERGARIWEERNEKEGGGRGQEMGMTERGRKGQREAGRDRESQMEVQKDGEMHRDRKRQTKIKRDSGSQRYRKKETDRWA